MAPPVGADGPAPARPRDPCRARCAGTDMAGAVEHVGIAVGVPQIADAVRAGADRDNPAAWARLTGGAGQPEGAGRHQRQCLPRPACPASLPRRGQPVVHAEAKGVADGDLAGPCPAPWCGSTDEAHRRTCRARSARADGYRPGRPKVWARPNTVSTVALRDLLSIVHGVDAADDLRTQAQRLLHPARPCRAA